MLAFINANLIDGTGAPPRKGTRVLIDGNKIAAVGRYITIPEDAELIDLRGRTLMPGLIDAHSHLGDHPYKDRPGIDGAEASDWYAQMRKLSLEAGVTTIRSCGDYTRDTAELRDKTARGELEGPRIFTSGKTFMRSDNHPAVTVWAGDPATVANCGAYPNSPDEARVLVREAFEEKMDFIKIVVSDMHISFWPNRGKQLDTEIISAIIDEAHKHGRPVACHVDNLDQANLVTDLGADEVHHLANMASRPYEATEYAKLFVKMCQNNVWLVPTISAQRAFEPVRVAKGCFDGSADYITNVLKNAYEAGVQFGLGCDSGCPGVPWGKCVHQELAEYVYNIGMTPLEAIKCACMNNARIAGMENRLGVIRAGAYADLLVLNRDPSDDICNIGSIKTVVLNGKIIANRRHKRGGRVPEEVSL